MALTNGARVNGDAKEENLPEEDPVTSSPYATRAIIVRIGPNGKNFTVFQALVEQYPKLQARMNQKKPGTPIELPEVDEDIGDTLIHFIYAQQYRTLGLGGVSEDVRAAAEFKRSVLAYCAARLCAIEALEDVTKSKMEHFSEQISIFDLQEVVAEVSAKLPSNEIWFPDHLYRWIKGMLLENDEILTGERLLDLVGKSALFDKAVVRSVTEMYSEKSAALKLFSSSETTSQNNTAAPVSKESHADADDGEEQPSESIQAVGEEHVAAEPETAEIPPYSASNGISSEQDVETGPEVKSPQSISEDWSVKAGDAGSTKTESVIVPETAPGSVVDGPAVNGKEDDELAKIDNISKAADSDVEAKTKPAKKKKSKSKKKSGIETQTAV